MRRQEFIAGLGSAAWPLTARAQQAAPVISWDPRIKSIGRGSLDSRLFIESKPQKGYGVFGCNRSGDVKLHTWIFCGQLLLCGPSVWFAKQGLKIAATCLYEFGEGRNVNSVLTARDNDVGWQNPFALSALRESRVA